MKLYSENSNYKLYQGNMLEMLEVIELNSMDSIVCDPPYELNFMNKDWDNSGIAFQPDTWKKCYEVLKPGGYLLAFGGSRTFHRIACAIEDAGFEIRDTIMWLYGSGFPKSLNIGNKLSEWQGWGSALKPSYEPIIVARKPFKGSLIDNIIQYGVGGINIDECRVGNEKIINKDMSSLGCMHDDNWVSNKEVVSEVNGRFPANTILTYDETDFNEVCGGFPQSKGASSQNNYSNGHIYRGQSLQESNTSLNGYREWYNDNGSASRYFYCAKASKKDRDEGLEKIEGYKVNDGRHTIIDNAFQRGETLRKNTHPTVKPIDLMQYLIRLATPNGGTILDPFNGSGSTGKAVMYENKERNKNYKYIGIELTEEYLPISKARIEYVCNLIEKEKTKDKQLSMFDEEIKCDKNL